MRQILVLILLSFTLQLSAQFEDDYDLQMSTLINNGRWFEALDYFDTNGEKLSEFMYLVSKGVLCKYTNRNEEAIEAITKLLKDYTEELQMQTISFARMLAGSYVSLDDYKMAAQIYENIVIAATPLVSQGYMAQEDIDYYKMLASFYANAPVCKIEWMSNKKKISLPLNTRNNAFYTSYSDNVDKYDIEVNMGTIYNAIQRDLADELGLIPLEINDIVCLDSIKIGNLLITNVIFNVYDTIPTHISQTRSKIVIGSGFMGMFDKVDFENNHLILNGDIEKDNLRNINMLFCDYGFLLGLDIKNTRESFLLSSVVGSNALLIDSKEHKYKMGYELQDEVHRLDVNNSGKLYNVKACDNFKFRMANKDYSNQKVWFGNLSEIGGDLFHFGVLGEIGVVNNYLFNNTKKVSFDFVNMRFDTDSMAK